jgi:hypothetical protein
MTLHVGGPIENTERIAPTSQMPLHQEHFAARRAMRQLLVGPRVEVTLKRGHKSCR